MEAIAIFLVLKLAFYIKRGGKNRLVCHFLYYYFETSSKLGHSALGKSLDFDLVGSNCVYEIFHNVKNN